MCANFEKIPKNDVLQIDGSIFGDILEFNQIEAPETTVFNRLVESNQKQTERASYAPKLLRSIRLEFIPGPVILQLSLSAYNLAINFLT